MMTPRQITDRAIQTVAENKILEAMEQGQFNNLPGEGKPLEILDEPYEEMWWIKRWIRRERLQEYARVRGWWKL
jgi:hypothetical protein